MTEQEDKVEISIDQGESAESHDDETALHESELEKNDYQNLMTNLGPLQGLEIYFPVCYTAGR